MAPKQELEVLPLERQDSVISDVKSVEHAPVEVPESQQTFVEPDQSGSSRVVTQTEQSMTQPVEPTEEPGEIIEEGQVIEQLPE